MEKLTKKEAWELVKKFGEENYQHGIMCNKPIYPEADVTKQAELCIGIFRQLQNYFYNVEE